MAQGPEKKLPEKSLLSTGSYGIVAAGANGHELGDMLRLQAIREAEDLYNEALLCNFKKNYDQAIGCLEKAYPIFKQHEDHLGTIRCLVEMAWFKYNHDENDGVAKSSRMFADAFKSINNHLSEPGINELRARLLHYQGLIKYREKQYGEAVKNFQYARNLCDPYGLEAARLYDTLGVHYERTNDYHRASQCLKQSLTIKFSKGTEYEQATTCQILGRLFILKEEYDKAFEYLCEALSISDKLGDTKRVVRIQNDLVKIHIYQDELEQAQKLIDKLKRNFSPDKGNRVYDMMTLFYQAYIHFARNEYDVCRALLEQEVIPVFRKRHPKGYGMALRLLASILHQEDKETEAIELMSEVISVFKRENEIAELAKTYFELGKIYLSLGERGLALSSMLEALKVAEHNGLSFLINYIEEEIFRLDEAKWQELVDKRAKHQPIFEPEKDLMEVFSSIGSDAKAGNSHHKSLVALLRIAQLMGAERDLNKLLKLISAETEVALEADRCTVFLYDSDSNELWSKVATGLDRTEEIRFPAHLGLAGYVAKTGEILNIKEAYSDPRFNKEIDKKTGYTTKSILCLPMRNRRMEIIGVFQMLNKADGYFEKADEDLLMAIATSAGAALENATLTSELKVSFDSFVKTLSRTIDARDPITAGHSERVAEYALLIGDELDLHEGELETLKYASLLHDIGKIGIREAVLTKEGRLTEKEYKHIQQHVYYTYEILENVHFERHLRMVPEIAAQHHEKIDGTGYWRGLKGNDIHLMGRILAISDVFDAITSRRHYRNRMPFDKVLDIMQRDAGTHFDPDCVNTFFSVPLASVGRILMVEYQDNFTGMNEGLLKKLDPQITMGEYQRLLAKDEAAMSTGEVEVHKLFSTIYHQTELCDLD